MSNTETPPPKSDRERYLETAKALRDEHRAEVKSVQERFGAACTKYTEGMGEESAAGLEWARVCDWEGEHFGVLSGLELSQEQQQKVVTLYLMEQVGQLRAEIQELRAPTAMTDELEEISHD